MHLNTGSHPAIKSKEEDLRIRKTERVNMVELVAFHSFLLKRMMAAADEIFDAVKDNMIAYQQEIQRLKEENCCLKNKNTLNNISSCSQTQTNNDAPSTAADELLQGTLVSELPEISMQIEVTPLMSPEPLDQSSTITISLSEETSKQEPNQCLTYQPEKDKVNGDLDIQTCEIESELCNNPDVHSNSSEMQSDINGRINVKTSKNLKKERKERQTPQFTCKICSKSFSRMKCLRGHAVVHQDERPFSCKSCGWCFKLKGHLREHERLHTGDYRYRCTKCEKGFSRSNLIKLHLKNAHST